MMRKKYYFTECKILVWTCVELRLSVSVKNWRISLSFSLIQYTCIFIHSSWTSHILLKFVFMLWVCGHSRHSISFLLSFQFFVLVLEALVRHIRTLTRRVTWSIQVSSSTRAFRYRRKLRVTDRHQRGILRGFSQPLFCIVLGVQDRSVPRSLTVHYYDGNYGAIIWINRDAHRNKPQSFLRQYKRLGTIRYEL